MHLVLCLRPVKRKRGKVICTQQTCAAPARAVLTPRNFRWVCSQCEREQQNPSLFCWEPQVTSDMTLAVVNQE